MYRSGGSPLIATRQAGTQQGDHRGFEVEHRVQEECDQYQPQNGEAAGQQAMVLDRLTLIQLHNLRYLVWVRDEVVAEQQPGQTVERHEHDHNDRSEIDQEVVE
jgi:hypothetical protein